MTKGAYIREARVIMNISQRRLAAYMGKTQQWVSKVEEKDYVEDDIARKITTAINNLSAEGMKDDRVHVKQLV